MRMVQAVIELHGEIVIVSKRSAGNTVRPSASSTKPVCLHFSVMSNSSFESFQEVFELDQAGEGATMRARDCLGAKSSG